MVNDLSLDDSATLDGLQKDGDLRYWIEPLETQVDVSGIEAFTGQLSTGVNTLPQVSHNILT